MKKLAVLLVMGLICQLGEVGARDLKADPLTGRIRVIYIGDAIGVTNPFPVLEADPLLMCTAVYACTIHQTTDEIRKSLRNYMPRTYSRFLNTDVIVLSDANKDAFRTEHFNWFKRGVIEEGMGLVMIGGAESFSDPGWPSWKTTEVADVLPCEMMEAVSQAQGGIVKIVDWEDEFIKSLPFKKLSPYGTFSGHNWIEPRMNAKLLAVLVHIGVGESPFLMWWDIGKGRTMAQSADWTPAGGSVFLRWQYWGDYAINMMLFLAGQKMSEGLEVVYMVRRRMRETNDAIAMLYNMVDLIEEFGGNADNVVRLITDVQEEKAKGMGFYVEAQLDEALQTFAKTVTMCDEAMDAALKARDAAAFWIFFTEWCVVTGTFLLAGSLLWVTMVKRRLYREITTTKLIREDA